MRSVCLSIRLHLTRKNIELSMIVLVAVDVSLLVFCCLRAVLAPLVLMFFFKTKVKAQPTVQVGHKSRILYSKHEELRSQRDRCTKYLQQRIKL